MASLINPTPEQDASTKAVLMPLVRYIVWAWPHHYDIDVEMPDVDKMTGMDLLMWIIQQWALRPSDPTRTK